MNLIGYALREEAIALKNPFVTALRRVEHAAFITLELMTDTGLRAFGNAPATEAVTGETLISIRSDLETAIIPHLFGHPFDLASMTATLREIKAGKSAKAAVDMALFSLAAQSAGVPLFGFLGASASRAIRTAVTISLDHPRSMLEKARAACLRGETILKIKVGRDDGLDLQRIRMIAQALPDADLLVDANQAWSAKQTLQIIDAIRSDGIALIEQPVPAEDLRGLAEITRSSSIPILADEAVFDAEDARRVINMGAADLINIKLMKCGGISEALRIIDLCEGHGIQCMLGSMLEGPVSIVAALHLAICRPETFAWFDLDSPLLYKNLPDDLPFSIRGNAYTYVV